MAPGTVAIPAGLPLDVRMAIAAVMKFDPDQPRDESGKWTETGAGASTSAGGGRVLSTYVSGGTFPPPPSSDERTSIDHYKGRGYADINDALNGKALPSGRMEQAKAMADGLAAVVDRSSLDQDTQLYRGTGGKYAVALTKLPVGSEFTLPSFQSTSSSERIANSFALGGPKTGPGRKPPVLIEIQTPRGTKALAIESFSKIKARDEKEVVLQRGLRYRVLGSRVEEKRIAGGFFGKVVKIHVLQLAVVG